MSNVLPAAKRHTLQDVPFDVIQAVILEGGTLGDMEDDLLGFQVSYPGADTFQEWMDSL